MGNILIARKEILTNNRGCFFCRHVNITAVQTFALNVHNLSPCKIVKIIIIPI
jgi:hypothetical protein